MRLEKACLRELEFGSRQIVEDHSDNSDDSEKDESIDESFKALLAETRRVRADVETSMQLLRERALQ